MKLKFVTFLLSGILALHSGCKRSPADVAASGARQRVVKSTPLTREELARQLTAGATRERLIEILGKPDSEIALNEAHQRLDYIYETPSKSTNRGDVIPGVTIFMERGALLRWSPILGALETTPIPKEGSEGLSLGRGDRAGMDRSALQFWALSDAPIADGRYVDTPRFSKLGYIGPVATLTISNLISSRSAKELVKAGGTSGDITNYVVNLELTRADADRFTQLCRDNLGRSEFITIGDWEVASQRLRSVISSQNLILPVENEALLMEVQQRLTRLVPTK